MIKSSELILNPDGSPYHIAVRKEHLAQNIILVGDPERIPMITKYFDVIDYQQILEKGNELFALYYPSGKNSNYLPIKAEVIAYFQFEQQQILKIHGLVRLIEGDPVDVDMK